MIKGTWRVLGPLLGVTLFCGALYLLHRELRQFHYHDIIAELRQLPLHRLLLAALFTGLNYWALTGYDVLALLYMRKAIPYRRIALASFASYSFSNNVGLSLLGAGVVRYRLYTLWGLSALEVGGVVVFCALTMWLGVLSVAGVAFLVHPLPVPPALHLPFSSFRPLGCGFLALVLGYLAAGLVRRRGITVRGYEFQVPSARTRAVQVALASVDWLLAGSVLYVLLPRADLPLSTFYAIFLTAQVSGLLSTVPGGLGVFETVILLLLKPYLPAPQILGSLLAFRAVYYLLPLCAAALTLGTHEVLLRREAGRRLAAGVAHWERQAVPLLFAAVAFLAGVVLLFSGATPAVPQRLIWLGGFLPLPVVEASHFLGSLVGVGLILVARGLQRRVDAAYHAAMALLAAGILFSLARGLDYEEALVLALLLAALAPCRREFYRRASLFSERFTPGWMAAVLLALVCTAWLGLFAYRHVEYSQDLWWRLSLEEGDAPRFLRGMVGVTGLALLVTLGKLLRPATPKPATPDTVDLEVVRGIVEQSPETYANLALLGDKSFLFNEERTAFVMFATHGRSWIALGDPVGVAAARPGLAWQFLETVDRYGGRTVFHNVGQEGLALYVDLGLMLLKIGEEARVPLETFSLEGGARKELRRTLRRLQDEGCTFEMIPAEEVLPLMPELRAVSDAWLARKHTQEKGFALGYFTEDYIRRFPVAVLRRDGAVIAFANVWLGAGRQELSPDLMRYVPAAPNGTMDCLFVELMLWGREQGYRWLDLGNAPLAGIEVRAAAPLWNRLSTFIYRHGSHFYNFEGLRAYKEKFGPVWEPRYLALPSSRALPQVLMDLSALTSGGVKGIFAR